MKRTLFTILFATALALTFSRFAQADSLILVTVGQNTLAPFTSPANVLSTGSFTFSGVSFADIMVVGNQPGSASGAFSTITTTAVTNTTSAVVNVSIGFASTNFLLPEGSPTNIPFVNLLSFNASQTVSVANFGTPATAVSQLFFGCGDGQNNLAPAGSGGICQAPPTCTVAPGDPTNACTTTSPLTLFDRQPSPSFFGLNGVEIFSLAPGQTADFSGNINAVGPEVPEPSSFLLFGTGLLILTGRRLRRK
jgi:hypothetical protein